MSITLRPEVKKKSIVTAAIAFALFVYNVFNVWSVFDFMGQKSGVVWQGLYLVIGTPTGARILVVIAMGLFMFTLLFDVKRDDKGESHWHETPDYDLTPKVAQAEEVKRGGHEEQALPPAERIFVDVSVEYLSGFFKEHTATQASKLVESFIGKWMRVTGLVVDVISEPKCLTVALEIPKVDAERAWISGLVVGRFYEQRWIDRAVTLRRTTTVTLIGQISRVTAIALNLENCELVGSDSTE